MFRKKVLLKIRMVWCYRLLFQQALPGNLRNMHTACGNILSFAIMQMRFLTHEATCTTNDIRTIKIVFQIRKMDSSRSKKLYLGERPGHTANKAKTAQWFARKKLNNVYSTLHTLHNFGWCGNPRNIRKITLNCIIYNLSIKSRGNCKMRARLNGFIYLGNSYNGTCCDEKVGTGLPNSMDAVCCTRNSQSRPLSRTTQTLRAQRQRKRKRKVPLRN